MTGQEIIDQFEELIEDSLDAALSLQLVNQAKNDIEGDRDWQVLRKRDATKSHQAKLTAIDLPDDFDRPRRLMIQDDNIPYDQVAFEGREQYDGYGRKYFIDLANSTYSICGSLAESKSVYFYYIYATDDLTVASSPVWPSRFHHLIAYKMAELYYAIDKGEKARAWDDRWSIFYVRGYQIMVDWDVALTVNEVETEMNTDQAESIEDQINLQP